MQQVWSLAGSDAIGHRTPDLIESSTTEIVLIVGDDSVLTDVLIATFTASDSAVDLLIGAVTDTIQPHIQDAVPGATTFISWLGWLRGQGLQADETAIGRLLLVDRAAILVSTIEPATNEEHAIYGEGFDNGLVVIARRLMAHGLLEWHDPST